MDVEPGMFESFHPCRYICFHYPNPCHRPKFHGSNNSDVEAEFLSVAVLDSPHPQRNCTTETAAMLVPKGREEDWIFSSDPGHCQLLKSAQVSRLVLIARKPSETRAMSVIEVHNEEDSDDQLKACLGPLLLALSPRSAFEGGLPRVPFVSYTDNVIRRVILEKIPGALVGMMLVEDVELVLEPTEESLQASSRATEWRRRLRFERMPNLIQTEVALLPNSRCKHHGKTSGKGLDLNRLVHPYLGPIVAGLVLVAPALEECLRAGKRPNVLCIGVGGGALPMFLNRHFEFHIVGVEIEEVVLKLAKKYFGLLEDEHLQISLGDGVEVVKRIAHQSVCNHFISTDLAQAWQDVLSSCRKPTKQFKCHDGLHHHGVEGPNSCHCSPDPGVKRPNSAEQKEFNLEQGTDEGSKGSCLSNLENIKLDHGLDEGLEEPGSGNSHALTQSRNQSLQPFILWSHVSSKDISSELDSNAKHESIARIQRKESEDLNEDDPRVHVIVLDVDAGDAHMDVSAPPSEFLEKRFLLAARIALHDHGILAINVVPSSKHVYNDLVNSFREVFLELYEIEVNNGENYVLFASPLCIHSNDRDSAIAHKVKRVISGQYMEQIRKL